MEAKVKQNNTPSTTMQVWLDVKSFDCPYTVGAETLTIFGLAYLMPNGTVDVTITEIKKDKAFIGDVLKHLNTLAPFQRYANNYGRNLFPIKNTGADTPEREDKSVIFDPAINLESSFNDFKTAI